MISKLRIFNFIAFGPQESYCTVLIPNGILGFLGVIFEVVTAPEALREDGVQPLEQVRVAVA